MKTLFTIAIVTCLAGVAAAQSTTNNSPSGEVTPPAVWLMKRNRLVSGVEELEVRRVEPRTSSRDDDDDDDDEQPTETQTWPDLQLTARSGESIVFKGSGKLRLDSIIEQLEPVIAPTRTSTKRRRTSRRTSSAPTMQLRYERARGADFKRLDFRLTAITDLSLLFDYFQMAGHKAVSHTVEDGFRISQQNVAKSAPDVDGRSARRYWLPVTITTADGTWTAEGNSSTVVSHRGKQFLVRVYRSVRRAPATGSVLPFEGARFSLSVMVVQVKETATETRTG